MNIIYRKNTLYVYLKGDENNYVIKKMEKKINNIMDTYKIENVVIKTSEDACNNLKEFKSRFNTEHKTSVIIS